MIRAQISLDSATYERAKTEDEHSYVLEGTLGALLGDDVVTRSARRQRRRRFLNRWARTA